MKMVSVTFLMFDHFKLDIFYLFYKKFSGTISISEMHEVVEKCDLNLTHDQLEELVETLDKNGDDRIQFEGEMRFSCFLNFIMNFLK